MENNRTKEYYTIDLVHVMRMLLRRAWLIILSGVLTAVIGFVIAAYAIAPKYSSSVMLYVNNSSFSLGESGFSISSSEITAAQNLVKTYSEILNNRTTLERVISKAGVSYTPTELSHMIVAKPSNNTEVMKVTVTTNDPYEAALIANCVADVLPERISEIIVGGSMKVVDSAIPSLDKVAPSITQYTVFGLLIGSVVTALAVMISAMVDDTIHDEEYVLQNYDCPILAKIPDLHTSGERNHEYGYAKKTASIKRY